MNQRVKHSGVLVPQSDLRVGTAFCYNKQRNNHPDRLKVNIWNIKDEHIECVRELYGIDRNIIMRNRGVGKNKRIELWCHSRKQAVEMHIQMKKKSKDEKMKQHISLGTNFNERERKTKDLHNSHIKYQSQKFLHWNARSLMNKIEELKQELDLSNAKVICVQEAWLPVDEKRHPRFKNFNIFNNSRANGRGGGVITLIHKSIVVRSHQSITTTNMEALSCDITINQDINIRVVNVYIPNQLVTDEELQKLLISDKCLLIMGDFNARHGSWNKGNDNRNGLIVYEWIVNSNLVLVNKNKEPTYQSPSTGSLSTLDLTLSSPDLLDIISNWYVGKDLISDHFPVYFNIDSKEGNVNAHRIITTQHKIKDANWPLFRHLTNNTVNCTESNTENIVQKLMIAASESIPSIKVNKNKQKPSNIWWNKRISLLRLERQKARKMWKKFRTPENRSKYNQASAKCKRAIKEAKRTSWHDFIGSINSNTPCSAVWKRFKAIQGKPDNKIYQITNPDGIITTNDNDIANVFNKLYVKKSGIEENWPTHLKNEKKSFLTTLNEAISQTDICDKPFTETEMKAAVAQLKSSTPGEDNIHNLMLQHCSESFMEEIRCNFTQIWETGNIPQKWKQAIIIPLVKPGKSPELASSYRPIALTSCLGKLLERLVNNRLTWRLENYNLLGSCLFGFRPKRSTCDALLNFTESIYTGFSNKMCTSAVFIDFEAAFDKVSRISIISQCMEIGLKGRILKYIVDFLKDRKIKTKINDTYSEEECTLNGIPQGSVISPTLFNIMMQNLGNIDLPGIGMAIFADDVTIWATDKDPTASTHQLEKALNKISEWSEKWGLTISISKTEVCFFSRRYLHTNYKPVINLNGNVLRHNPNPVLLGIKLDPKLLWKEHVHFIADKCANRIKALKVIASRAWGADTYILRNFYLSFVRSKIMYCCEVWGGTAETHIRKLQILQNSSLRICLGCPKTTSIQSMEIELSVMPFDLYIKNRMWKKHFQMKAISLNTLSNIALVTNIRQSLFYHHNKPCESLNTMESGKIPVVLEQQPWLRIPIKTNLEIPGSLTKEDSPHLLKSVAMELINTTYNNFVKIYTDGSVDKENHRGGAAFHCPELNEDYYVPCDSSSSMNAELMALNAALVFSNTMDAQNICILTDSRSALQALQVQHTTDYHFRTSEITKLLKNLEQKNIVFQWIPSHCGVPGNEEADRSAKESCNLFPSPESCYSLTNCKEAVDKESHICWRKKWRECNTGREYYSLQKQPNDPKIFKSLSRSVASFAARARMGHIVTNTYLKRFHITNDSICGVCKQEEETLEHILLKCPVTAATRSPLIKHLGRECTLDRILKESCFWPLAECVYRRHRAIEANLGSS